MKTLQLIQLNQYINKGQNKEVSYIYTLTGSIPKADNKAHWLSCDYLNQSIKSERATLTNKTLDIVEYLKSDKANEYVYITNSYKAYIMNENEFKEFLLAFTYIDRDSDKNGGKQKLRLKSESKSMLEWLGARA